MRGFSGTTEPSKYFFNVATPELIHKSVGSLTGINDALGSIVCHFDWKKSKNICRTCALLNCFILLPSFFILNDKKTQENFPCVRTSKTTQYTTYLELSYITIIPHFFRTCNGTILKTESKFIGWHKKRKNSVV